MKNLFLVLGASFFVLGSCVANSFEKAHSYRGELVFVDHVNRRGSIRVQGANDLFRGDPRPFAMIVDLQKNFHWVLQTVGYKSKDQLLEHIDVAIIERANKKHEELRKQKAKEQEVLLLDKLVKRRKAK